ncbi:putative protein cornichon-like 2 [Vitis vinifera]|uniref:Uncharacterized protein n=1 Tax=Vitis vinifera TaxID=29760 RepID=A0A438ESK6_VITVI|nr:putative protein cornichon-like 2 [Vitis vinifera]
MRNGLKLLPLVYVTLVWSIPVLQCETRFLETHEARSSKLEVYLMFEVRASCIIKNRELLVLRLGYQRRQHLIDVTEIFNLLNWEKKQRLFKLGYLIFLLFLSIFWMILSALEDHDND